jgi:uncharacterized protein
MIKQFVEKENVLLARRATQFGYSQYLNFEDLVDSSFKILVLETTEQCNYRCRYCIYNPAYAHRRNHGDRAMSAHIASASIDYLDKHSSKLDSVSITFYGGEPLIGFDLIKSCVDYSRSAINKNKTVNYSLTTNGSLITKDVARYLNENAFNITLSLDGPKDDHDSYRIDSGNKGTFERTIGGLINLHEAFGKSFSTRVVINTVYTPPYSEAKLDRLTSL